MLDWYFHSDPDPAVVYLKKVVLVIFGVGTLLCVGILVWV